MAVHVTGESQDGNDRTRAGTGGVGLLLEVREHPLHLRDVRELLPLQALALLRGARGFRGKTARQKV